MKRGIKLLSFLISICLLGVTPAVAAGDDNSAKPDITAVEKLTTLGVWNMEWDLTAAVTRGGLAQVTAQILGYQEGGGEPSFEDVLPDNPCYGAVSYLCRMQMISGSETGRFDPFSAPDRDQIVKLFVSAAGYREYAEYQGGYPAGYLLAARRYDLLPSGFLSGGTGQYTYGDLVGLLETLLDANVMEQTSFGTDSDFVINHDETVLSTYHGIYVEEGTLRSLQGRRAEPEAPAGRGMAVIGDRVMDNGLEAADPALLGYRVRGYYIKAGKAQADDLLLYLEKDVSKVRELVIDGDLIEKVDGNTITYRRTEASASSSAITIGREMATLYNYDAVDGYTEEDLKAADKIVFAGTGSSYTVVSLVCEETVVVKSVERTQQRIYDRYGAQPLDLLVNDDTKLVSVQMADGSSVDATAIETWDVLSVLRDREDRFYTISICRDTISGTLDTLTPGSGLEDRTYTVDGKDYSLANNRARVDFLSAITVGSNVRLYLNRNGEIAAIEPLKRSSDFKYGYVSKLDYHQSGLENYASVLIYTEDGELLTLDTESEVRITDRGKVKSADLERALKENNVTDWQVRQLVQYKLSESGRIKELMLAERQNGAQLLAGTSSFNRYKDFSNVYYNKDFTSFLGNFRISEDTMILYTPQSEKYLTEETCYGINSLSEFGGGACDVETYHVTPDRTAGVIVIHTDNGMGVELKKNTAVTVVSDIVKTVDSEGLPRTTLTGYRGWDAVEVLFADHCSETQQYQSTDGEIVSCTIEKGDLIRYGTNSAGEICDWEKIFSANDSDYATKIRRGWEYPEAKAYMGSPKTSMIQYHGNADDPADVVSGRVWQGDNPYWFQGVPFAVEFGIVRENTNNVLQIETIGGSASSKGDTVMRYANMNNRAVYVIDQTRDEVRPGSLKDVYAENNDNRGAASRVIYIRFQEVPSMLVVVKRK